MSNSDNKTAIQFLQLQQMFSGSYVSLVASILLAFILAFMQRQVIAPTIIFAWLSVVVLLTIFRAALVIHYRRSPKEGVSTIHSRMLNFRIGVIVTGVVWGSASFLMFPANDPEHQMFLIFMLAGLTAGGVASYSADLVCAIGFSVPTLVPLAIRLFATGGSLSVAMGMAITIYLGFMILSGRKSNRHIRDNIVLRLEASSREKSVRTSEEQYRLLLRHSPVGLFHYDANLVITYCNDRLADILKSTAERIVGLDMNTLKDQSVLPALRKALEGEIALYEGHYLSTVSNVDGWIAMTCAPSRDNNENIVGGIAIVQDISDKKLDEQALKQSKEQLVAILNSTTESIFHVDREGIILAINDMAAHRVSQEPQDMIGKCAFDYFPPEVAGSRREGLEDVFRTGKAKYAEDTRNGHFFSLNYYPIVGNDGKVSSVVVYAADITKRKSLEEAIVHERDFAESLIETARAIVLVLDTEGRIVRFNHYMEELSGYRLDEVKGASWFSTFLPEQDQDTILKLFKKALTEISTQANINPIVAKNGREILVEWRDKTLKDSAGNVVGLLAIGQDVTLREQTAESQRLLKAAVEQSNSSIVVTDADGKIVFVNAGFIHTSGYTMEDVIGQNPRVLKSGKMPTEVYETLWDAITSGNSWSGELCNKKKNGELYWETANISPIIDEHGKITHFLAVKDDITLRKQAETALQEQKNFLAAILENEPECVKVLGAGGNLLQMNAAGLAMLEIGSVEEANTYGLVNFVMPEHRAAFMVLVQRVFKGETGVLEYQVEGKHGSHRWLETHATPLRDASGEITYLLGVTRDVTRRREAEERLVLSLKGADLAMADWYIPGDTLILGEGWLNLLGYQPGELRSQTSSFAKLIRPEDAQLVRDTLIRHLKGQTPYFEVEIRMRHKDGHWVWVLGRGMAVERSADGRAVRVAGTAMDISLRKKAEAEITRLSQWNELLLNSAGEGIFGADREGRCTFINPAALTILGFSKEEVLGNNQHIIFHHHHKDGSPYPQKDCPISQTLHDGIQRKVEDAFIRKSGEIFPVQLTVTPMHENGQIVGAEAVFQDIAQRKEMELELVRLATTDSLTGMANRRHFIEQLEISLAHVIRFGKPTAFLMVDIDHFKNVNDTYGHATGDAALKHFANLTNHRLRRIDLLGRLGGEEFGIMLPGTDAAGAMIFAERLRRQIAETPAQSKDGTIPITISIGIAMFTASDTASDSIMARADEALYRAKSNGRNRVEVS